MIIQNINFIPAPPIFVALIATASILIFLLLLSHQPFKIISAAQRLWFATLVSFLFWIFLLLINNSFVNLTLEKILDLSTGAIIMLIGSWFSLNAWMFLVWGFRFNMLLSLSRQRQPVTKEEWISDYTGGCGLERFLDDRLGLALRLGAAKREGDQIKLTQFGVFTAYIVKIGRGWFGFGGKL